MEADLSRGAVATMSRHQGEGLRPVLQVVDAPRIVGSSAAAAALVLSDGAHLLRGLLPASLNHLIAGGALRRGSVVRVLEYVCSYIQNQRVIIVIQLEILQVECALIGNPTIYEANATQLDDVSAQNIVDAKMQQLSLNNDHQNQNLNFAVSTTGWVFGSLGNACGSPLAPSYLLSPPMSMDGTRVPRNESPLRITPINALSPYQVRWRIKARVTAKTDLKHFTNTRGPGKVFSFDLLDVEGGEVRATCFSLQAEQCFDLIEVDRMYLISEGSLKPAQKEV
ncbi:hypothetical protein HU200_020185 [Digitaria exilis]|uniref:Replication protein A 70 kDa DNA-binding subunit n=1 Tax=Digitaria exilis TaxID=1010633 RepID=A0A835KD51_9POAL|nr:hypothetical protein HU200_020185 [Digitaria exilis]